MAQYTTNENLYKWSASDTKQTTITETALNADKIDVKLNDHTAQLASIVTHDSISPDVYTGTDAEKVQKSIDDALIQRKAVKLDRLYNIENATLIINNPDVIATRKTLYFYGVNGGGIEKNVSGFMFSALSANNGDFSFTDVYFESTAGVGTKVFDCDKLIRFKTNNCFFKNIDTVLYTSDNGYIQSVTMDNDVCIGGQGYMIDIAGSYGLNICKALVEFRDGFFNHRNVGEFKNLSRSSIKDCTVESLWGKTMILGGMFGFDVSGNYFEYNEYGIEFLSDAYIYNFSFKNNYYFASLKSSTSFVKWAGHIFGAISENNACDYNVLHDTTNVTEGHIFSINDNLSVSSINNVDPGNRILEHRAYNYKTHTTVSDGVDGSTSKLGLFTRRVSTAPSFTIPAGEYINISVPFLVSLALDDFISVQAVLANTTDKVIVCNSMRSGSTVIVKLKNEMATTATVNALVVTVLTSFSITG